MFVTIVVIFRVYHFPYKLQIRNAIASLVRRRKTVKIADVIRSANSEHQVYFLLTAYIRTMPFYDKLSRMPEPITRLPLNGIPDVRSRFGKLMIELDTASKQLDDTSCSSIKGAVHVFGA